MVWRWGCCSPPPRPATGLPAGAGALAERFGWQRWRSPSPWRSPPWCRRCPVLPESPAQIGIGPYGSAAVLRPRRIAATRFPIALTALFRAVHSRFSGPDVELWECAAFSTNGLINTHPHRLLLRSRHLGGEWRLGPRGGRVFSLIGPRHRVGWATATTRDLAVLVLFAARAVADVVRSRQFDASACRCLDFSGLDWVATGPRPSRDQGGVRAQGHAGRHFVELAAIRSAGASPPWAGAVRSRDRRLFWLL